MLRTFQRLFSSTVVSCAKTKSQKTTSTARKKSKTFKKTDMGEVCVAIEGCGHGTLTKIYESTLETAKKHNTKVDLLIVCGDFQAVRNHHDLPCMSVPMKFRALGEFYEYYSGEKQAPIPTIFIGGNHEASNHLWELYYGGWVAPNIYYLGGGGVVNFGGLRIAGLSGIYSGYDYQKPHYERLPYDHGTMRSIYHVRAYDVFKLFQLQETVDIGLSHDWPDGIAHHGNLQQLLREKPFFKSDIEKGELGSPPAMNLLKRWKPRYWFSGHMHVKFTAVVTHDSESSLSQQTPPTAPANQNVNEISLDIDEEDVPVPTAAPVANKDEIDLDMDEDDVTAPAPVSVENKDEIDLDLDEDDIPAPAATEPASTVEKSHNDKTVSANVWPKKGKHSGEDSNNKTRFLALDKCLPGRGFLQILKIQSTKPGPKKLQYDPEWLAVTRALNPILEKPNFNPQDLNEAAVRIPEERIWVEENIVAQGKLDIPQNFVHTAPTQDPKEVGSLWIEEQSPEYHNPQTKEFCDKLQIFDVTYSTEEQKAERIKNFRGVSHGGGRGGRRGGGRGGGRGGRGRGRGRGH